MKVRASRNIPRGVLIVCARDVSLVEVAGLETPPREGLASARLEGQQALQLRRHPFAVAAARG
jgi:hypothetical protein